MLVGKLHTGQIVGSLFQEVELLGPAPGKHPLNPGEFSTQVCTLEPWWRIVDLLYQEIEFLGPAPGKPPLSLVGFSTQVYTVEPWWWLLLDSLRVLAAQLVGKAGLGR